MEQTEKGVLQMGNYDMEEEEFKRIAGEKDIDIFYKKDISYMDFERLGFILEKMNLLELESDFFKRHCNKFGNEIKEIEQGMTSVDVKRAIDTYTLWLKNFRDNIKKTVDKLRIDELFGLQDNGES